MAAVASASVRGAACDDFLVMSVVAKAAALEAQGRDVVHMEVGQPAAKAPSAVLAAAQDALGDKGDALGYTIASGRPCLRRAIAAHYQETYSVDIDAEQEIVIVTGSSAAFSLGFLAAFDAGDRVLTAAPGYPCYINILKTLGVNVEALPTDAATNFQLTPKMLKTAAASGAPVRGVVVASPSNPTGTVLSADELRAIAEWCDEHGAWLVSDEIYHGIAYGGVETCTARQFTSNAIVINSFSKYYCMTGWRLGWMLVPAGLRQAVYALQQNMFINAPTLAQRAAVAAFSCRAELDAHVATYALNREALLRDLPSAGFPHLSSAQGAFYLYADASHLVGDGGSIELCDELLQKAGVACAPGVDFDKERGDKSIRFSFCGSHERTLEGIRRLKRWYEERGSAQELKETSFS